ncbi:DUF6443 domain-containing protein [Aquimarina sp. 2201CG1-2-11]|uniref:DUF6443 domain-containing protein n=1 Tax=Aquimarina discodermiae TaxID=3231043 RepID=UPI00346289D9
MRTTIVNKLEIHSLLQYVIMGFIILITESTTAQGIRIYGSQNVDQYSTYTYSVSGNIDVSTDYISWRVVGGTITHPTNHTSTSAKIKWTALGSGRVEVSVYGPNGGGNTKLAVTIHPLGSSATPTPKISQTGCGWARLSYTGTPPSGTKWYWQGKDSDGTSTTKGSGSTYTAREGSGRYYLRGRDSQGRWGRSTSVNVSFNSQPMIPLAPTSIVITCDKTVLTKGTPPPMFGNVTWYWQDVPMTTYTSPANAAATITRIGEGTVYLRARENRTGCWSNAREVRYKPLGLPEKPDTPTITNQCGETVITRNAPLTGSNVTLYWQNEASGINTSTANAAATVTKTSGSMVYLRAKHNTTGCWSPAREVPYTIHITTWYMDADKDGFGDPNETKKSCEQPTGYVTDNTDQCPNEYDPYIGCAKSSYELNLSAHKNYIYTRVYQEGMNSYRQVKYNEDVLESITYFDGLGRPIQQTGIKTSPYREDIVNHIEYDQLGRLKKGYLPYQASESVGSFRDNAEQSTRTFYNTSKYENTTNPFSEKEFESSPLSRVLKQAAPGNDWRMNGGHEIEFDYTSNVANEVRQFEVSFTDGDTENPILIEGTDYYGAGKLHKTSTYDENHTSGKDHSTEEFKNTQGQIILKRTYNSSSTSSGGDAEGVGGAHDTYYIYDRFGNLTFVIPPKVDTTDGISDIELNELCYQYKYDNRNRLIEKKIPGKGWEYIVYNKLDQPILIQDVLLKANDQWLFNKYDAFGRVAYTGKMTIPNKSRLQLQQEANDFAEELWVTRSEATNIGGVSMYYTDGGYPKVTTAEVLTINYYDYYTFLGNTPDRVFLNPNTLYRAAVSNTAKTLSTGSKVKVLGTNDWITTVTYYDQKGRPVYTATKNDYLSTTDSVESKLDFTGKVQETTTTHTKDSHAAIVTIDKFTYDHMGRLQTQIQKIGNHEELIVSNTYDALGQLESKKVGGSSSTSGGGAVGGGGLQKVDYDYNVRGWLTAINEGKTDNGDLFGFKISYNSPEKGAMALFNGNISETQWQTANDHVNRHYTYSYDALNRITGAISNDGNYNLSNVTYDKVGNILSLDRKGYLNDAANAFGDMDKLVYNYSHNEISNKLLKVTDNTTNTFGFKDGNKTGDDYSYDANGNLLVDRNKNISGIVYNHLNLPTRVNFNGGTENISYVYDANGIKQKKIVTESGGRTFTDYAPNHVYKNGNLEYFSIPEGYVTTEDNSFKYVYQFKDHLGNVRLSYTDADNNGTVEQSEIIEEKNYYPFGLTHKGYNGNVSSLGNSTAQLRGFGEKEEQNELGLGWIDITARNYDPALGRWMNIDLLAENNQFQFSPYHYVKNSPIQYNDPDGMIWRDPQKARDLLNTVVVRIGNRLSKRAELSYQLDNDELNEEEKAEINNGIKDIDRAISKLEQSAQDIIDLGADTKNMYDLTEGDASDGQHSVSLGSNGIINIEGSNNAEHIHELTHAALSLRLNNGDHNFTPKKNLTTKGAPQIVHERTAYEAQFHYAPGTLPESDVLRTVTHYRQISLPYIANIKGVDGKPTYEKLNAQWYSIKGKTRRKHIKELRNFGKK